MFYLLWDNAIMDSPATTVTELTYYVLRHSLLVPKQALVVLVGGQVAVDHLGVVLGSIALDQELHGAPRTHTKESKFEEKKENGRTGNILT